MMLDLLIGLGVIITLFFALVLAAPWITIGCLAYFKWADKVINNWNARKNESIPK